MPFDPRPDKALHGWKRLHYRNAGALQISLTNPPLTAYTSEQLLNAPAVDGRYHLREKIAEGGMGDIHRAFDDTLKREVALKVILAKHAHKPEIIQRFLEECRITGQLQHPAIPPVHDLGTLPDGRPYLAMKLIKGQTLSALLPTLTSVRQKLAIFESICQAVAYAHSKGVIHRDLKPANVMVGAFGETQVMDWGLAKILASRERERSEQTGTIFHNPREGSGDSNDICRAPARLSPFVRSFAHSEANTPRAAHSWQENFRCRTFASLCGTRRLESPPFRRGR